MLHFFLIEGTVGAGIHRRIVNRIDEGRQQSLLIVAAYPFMKRVTSWPQAVLGALIASTAALVCQVVTTRDWGRIAEQLRGADRRAWHDLWTRTQVVEDDGRQV